MTAKTIPFTTTKSDVLSSLGGIIKELDEAMEIPTSVQTSEAISIDEKRKKDPIGGLINRLLPSKIVLRMLALQLANKNSQWIDYKEFCEFVVTKSIQLRLQIERQERKLDVTRGESLKVGLPLKDTKSQQRFINFYIGKVKSDGSFDGILGDLELGVIKKHYHDGIYSTIIGITKDGLGLAKLHSPVLDDVLRNGKRLSTPLSNEETLFLLQQIKRVRPGEFEFLNLVFKLIENGSDNPTALNRNIQDYFISNNFSTASLKSILVGCIGRLVEMKIIKIRKNGVYTNYQPNINANLLAKVTSLPNMDAREL
ncbi:MAG: hypothetical protein L0H55_10445 [Candidatus Nitrosocosmicus sp.]|nr:hypothetical protein [Candidatus Nitrosocosmicus sp.]